MAGPGHKAVDGSLTGADIQDHSLSGADIFNKSITGLSIADGSLTGSQIAGNSLTGANIDESSLGTVPNAAHAGSADNATNASNAASAGNSALLGGLAPGAYGMGVRSASQRTSGCGNPGVDVACAPLLVKVPAGRAYDAIVWSSITVLQSGTGNQAVKFCPAVAQVKPVAGANHCLTKSGGFEDGINVQPNYTESATAFGSTSMLNQHLTPGIWDFNTNVNLFFGGGSFTDNAFANAHTTVLVFDSAVPELPVDPAPGELSSSGTSGETSSSGTSSSGASSGETSGGTTGCASSSGASSGETSSGC